MISKFVVDQDGQPYFEISEGSITVREPVPKDTLKYAKEDIVILAQTLVPRMIKQLREERKKKLEIVAKKAKDL